jgi:hypothetical protein
MATNKKTPPPPPTRKAAKPPVINLKATEVKSADKSAPKPATTGKADAAPTGTKKPAGKTADTNKPSAEKAKTARQASKDTKPASPTKPVDKATNAKPADKKPLGKKPAATSAKKGRKGLVLASLAALVAAGVGGAWAFKEYGSRFFTPPNAISSEQLGQLATRLEKLENAEKPAIDGNLKAATEKLSRQIAEAARKTAANSELIKATNSKILSLEKSVSDIRTALTKAAKAGGDTASAATALKFGELSNKLAAVEQAVAEVKAGKPLDSSKAVEGLKTQLADLQAAFAQSQAQTEKITSQLQTALAEVARKATTAKANPAAELARAFTVLRAKVSSGSPFVDELDQFAARLPQATQIDVLRPLAKTGAPTTQSLKAALADVSVTTGPGKAATQQSDKKPQGGIFSGLTKSLTGLVKVSRVGEVDWAALKQQARQAIANGHTSDAIKALQHDGAPKDVQEWLALASKKVQAEKAISGLSAIVMARLTTSQ